MLFRIKQKEKKYRVGFPLCELHRFGYYLPDANDCNHGTLHSEICKKETNMISLKPLCDHSGSEQSELTSKNNR